MAAIAIHATIGAVIVKAMPRSISDGASVSSCARLLPAALNAHPAGTPSTTMPANIATTISR